MTSLNSLPGSASSDRLGTVETTSGERTTTTSGLRAVDPDVARFWLQRHVSNMASNMASLSSHRFARAFLPLQAPFQGQGHCQGQTVGQGQYLGEDFCYSSEDQSLDFSKARDYDCFKAQGGSLSQLLGQGHCQGQSRGGGQLEDAGMDELKKLSESGSPTSAEKKNLVMSAAVDVI